MSACEKCWGDAYLRSLSSGKSQTECYYELLEERRENPCTPEEQRRLSPVEQDDEAMEAAFDEYLNTHDYVAEWELWKAACKWQASKGDSE